MHRCVQVPAIPTLAQQIYLAAPPAHAPEHDPFDRALALGEAITQARVSRVHDRMIGAMLELHEQAEHAWLVEHALR